MSHSNATRQQFLITGRLALFLLLALVTLLLWPLPAAAQEGQAEPSPTLTVTVPALNVRAGPGPAYPPVSFMMRGEQATIIGQDQAGGWYQVRFVDGTSGWVTNGQSYVAVSGNIDSLDSAPPASVYPSQSTIQNSPSGTLVFQTAPGGSIYAINPDGRNLRYLTSGMDPAISPNGQTVAFTRWETNQPGALGNVWLINIDGSNERVVHEYVYNPRTPVWSPDGSQLAIGMQQGGRVQPESTCGNQRPPREAYETSVGHDEDGKLEFCYTVPADPHWGLRRIDLAGGQHQDLPNDTYSFSPAWDPLYSGRLIYDGDRGLVNLDLPSGATLALTDDFNDHSPVFSPDGSRIAVSYRQDDHWEVHLLNADGSGRQRLTQTSYQTLVEQQLAGQEPRSYNNAAPVWSPDGSQIAFLSDRSGQWEIWLMNSDGSNQQPLVTAAQLAEAGISLTYNGVDEQSLSWR